MWPVPQPWISGLNQSEAQYMLTSCHGCHFAMSLRANRRLCFPTAHTPSQAQALASGLLLLLSGLRGCPGSTAKPSTLSVVTGQAHGAVGPDPHPRTP